MQRCVSLKSKRVRACARAATAGRRPRDAPAARPGQDERARAVRALQLVSFQAAARGECRRRRRALFAQARALRLAREQLRGDPPPHPGRAPLPRRTAAHPTAPGEPAALSGQQLGEWSAAFTA
eukprot:3717069-Pleurochrysis_carterae.AAC.2